MQSLVFLIHTFPFSTLQKIAIIYINSNKLLSNNQNKKQKTKIEKYWNPFLKNNKIHRIPFTSFKNFTQNSIFFFFTIHHNSSILF